MHACIHDSRILGISVHCIYVCAYLYAVYIIVRISPLMQYINAYSPLIFTCIMMYVYLRTYKHVCTYLLVIAVMSCIAGNVLYVEENFSISFGSSHFTLLQCFAILYHLENPTEM